MMRRVDSVPSFAEQRRFPKAEGRVQLLWKRAGRKENNEDGCVGRISIPGGIMQERGRQRGKVREGLLEDSNVYAPASGLTGSDRRPGHCSQKVLPGSAWS